MPIKGLLDVPEDPPQPLEVTLPRARPADAFPGGAMAHLLSGNLRMRSPGRPRLPEDQRHLEQ